MKKTTLFTLILNCCAAFAVSAATEYFVGVDGCDDGNDGLSPVSAFGSIQRGVDALGEGDILTILPGEYFETVFREDLGGAGAETLIRAAIPGTAVLRGDVAAPEFHRVDGYRYVYGADFDQPVQAVNERDTLKVLQSVSAMGELEFVPGAFYHDVERGKLYISTSDMAPAGEHDYTVSVLANHGLYLEQPQRVVIEGLVATGFHSAAIFADYPGYRTTWGIIIGRGTDCVIRDCTAFFNGGGIGLFTSRFRVSGGGNVIEGCTAWANSSRYSQEGGNILAFSVNNDIIRDSYAYRGGRHGIRLYGGIGSGLLERCIAWGNAGGSEGTESDLFIKGGVLGVEGRAENCVAVGAGHVMNLYNSLIGGHNQYHRDMETPRDSIRLVQEEDLIRDVEFADPDNFDFRLQADSRFRGAAPDGSDRGPFPYEKTIFYLSPEGDDGADGLALRRAWRSVGQATAALRGGDTLYFTPDTHRGGLTIESIKGDRPLQLRGRGVALAVIEGEVRVAGSGPVTFERLRFTGPVVVDGGSEVTFLNCEFADRDDALVARDVYGLRIEHCRFPAGGPVLRGSQQVYLAGNRFEGEGVAAVNADSLEAVMYSDYNAYLSAGAVWQVGGEVVPLAGIQGRHDRHSRAGGMAVGLATAGPNGKAVGPYRVPEESVLRVAGPFVHATTDTTADLEWWTSSMTECELSWTGPDGEVRTQVFQANGFTTFSLTGLQPDTAYEFRVAIGDAFESVNGQRQGDAVAVAFRTAAAAPEPVTWYVATDGSDRADGRSRGQALRTVTAAAARTRAGDTVIISEGTYRETVRVRSTGTVGRPVTFRSAPGEKVVFDGDKRAIYSAFVIAGKDDIHIDGFYFSGFGTGGAVGRPFTVNMDGVIMLYQADRAQITRCFKDGRGSGYSPNLVAAWQCTDLLVKNCVITVGFTGLSAANCPGLRLENNVFLRNMIQAMIVVNAPEQPFYLERNIITDSGANKTGVCILEIGRAESLVHRDNCYILRIPDAEKRPFMFYGTVAYSRTVAPFELPASDSAMVFEDLTRLSVADFQARFGDDGSVTADAVFAVTQDMDTVNAEGNKIFLPDRVIGIRTLDFPDLFTADPELAARNIGLEAEAFDDFHFNRQ